MDWESFTTETKLQGLLPSIAWSTIYVIQLNTKGTTEDVKN